MKNEPNINSNNNNDNIKILIEKVNSIEERVKKGLTQQQLADKCGMKQSAIARMESIESIPRLDTIIRVATALEMTMDLQTSKTVSLANAIPLDSYRNLSYTDNAFSTYKPTTMKSVLSKGVPYGFTA